MLRVEDADPENLLKSSFYQYQVRHNAQNILCPLFLSFSQLYIFSLFLLNFRTLSHQFQWYVISTSLFFYPLYFLLCFTTFLFLPLPIHPPLIPISLTSLHFSERKECTRAGETSRRIAQRSIVRTNRTGTYTRTLLTIILKTLYNLWQSWTCIFINLSNRFYYITSLIPLHCTSHKISQHLVLLHLDYLINPTYS